VLTKTLTDYDTPLTFTDICIAAIDKVNNLDFDGVVDSGTVDVDDDVSQDEQDGNHPNSYMKVTHPRTIMMWMCVFCTKSKFPNPAVTSSN
jgi:hypothetical protein